LAEYRLDDLARISGVSSRNIRAYRERGLLDPPRRQGRSAFYDDYHLSQLKTINQLLRKGFNSAHIAEFFARMREGHDLAAILGVQQAILGGDAGRPRPATVALDLDPQSDDAVRLVSCGLAEVVGDSVALVDPQIAEIVARSADQHHCVQTILGVVDSIGGSIDALAMLIQNDRDLGIAVVAHQLDKALQRHMVSAVSDSHTPMVANGQLGPGDSRVTPAS
jgi:DNA-binding transcriptional MerR regulator